MINGALHLARTPCSELLQQYKTPFFAFFPGRIKENCEHFLRHVRDAFPRGMAFYSVKSNPIPGILRHVAPTGMGAQVVNLNEYNAAICAGFKGSDVLLDGLLHDAATFDVAATRDGPVLVESWMDNISRLQDACREHGTRARLGLRLRMPGGGHRLGISTRDENDISGLSRHLAAAGDVDLCMLACHPGSQRPDEKDHLVACKHVLSVHDKLERRGLAGKCKMLDLGGGFPEPEMANRILPGMLSSIADTIHENHEKHEFTVCFEPGRYIISDAGVLVARINKLFNEEDGSRWALLDAGMDVITRVSNSHLRFFSVEHAGEAHGTPISFQGRLPTEIDLLGKCVHFTREVHEGEHAIVLNVGAYSATFSTRFTFDGACTITVDENGHQEMEVDK